MDMCHVHVCVWVCECVGPECWMLPLSCSSPSLRWCKVESVQEEGNGDNNSAGVEIFLTGAAETSPAGSQHSCTAAHSGDRTQQAGGQSTNLKGLLSESVHF